MRSIELARIAAEAEGVRIKTMLRRQAMRGVYGGVAALFALFMLVMVHMTIFEFLRPSVGAGFSALILVGLDLLGAAVFGIIAMRDTPSGQEREAALISRQARAELSSGLRTLAVVTPFARLVGGKGLRGSLLSAAATHFLSRKRRR